MKSSEHTPYVTRDGTLKRAALVLGVALSAFSATAASAQEPPPVVPLAPGPASTVDLSATPDQPVVVHENKFMNRPLFVSGLILFAGTYSSSMIVGAESSRSQDHADLFYPVVGPWIDIGHRDCAQNTCTNETGAVTLLILDGIGQGIGAIAMLASVAIPERITRTYLFGNEKLSVSPMRLSASTYGMGAHGSF